MQNKKLIMFDFDGTIADSEEVLFEVMNELSSKFGFRKIQKDEILSLKKMTVGELMKDFRVSCLKLPFIIARARKIFRSRIANVMPVEGMLEAMKELKAREYRIIIVTTNKKATVEEFLKNHEVEFVDTIVGGGSLFGKATTLKKVVDKEQVFAGDTFYVGDEIRDILAAKKAGIGIISVAWGFNSTDALKKYDPEYLIINPHDLLGILK